MRIKGKENKKRTNLFFFQKPIKGKENKKNSFLSRKIEEGGGKRREELVLDRGKDVEKQREREVEEMCGGE